ncbi:phage tail tape measure protein, partial [Nocardia sp. NPDC059239]
DAVGKVRVAEAKLQELRDKGNATASQLARAEEAVATAQRNADRQTRTTQRAVQDLSDARAAAANATDGAAESEGRFHGALGKLMSKIDPAVGQMAGLAAATAGVGSAMELAADAMANEKLNDKLAAQLGATPQMAEEFGHIAGQLYANAYGEDLGQVNDALKNVWQQGLVDEDANDAEIQKVTASVLNLASAFDEDVSGAAAAVGTMLKTGMAPDAQAAMDILTRGFQQGADKGQDLLDTFVEYPTLFRSLGMDGQEAMGLISQALQAGARNADQVADALKEFQLRAIDGSESTAAAYEALGLDAQAMGAQIAQGGDAANQGLAIVLDRLRGIEDPLARNAAAVGLFGTKAEDMADALFAMDPTTAVASLGQVTGAADQLDQTLNNNTATSLEKFKRGIHEAMVEKMGEAIHWIQENQTTAMVFAGVLGTLAGAVVAVKVATVAWNTAQTIASGATKAWTAVQWLWNAAMSANPIGIVVVAIAALVAGIIYAYNHSEKFREIVQGAFDAIKTAALFLWDNVLKPYFEWWMGAFQAVGDVAMWLWDNAISPAFDGITAGAQRLWSDFLSPIFTDIKILIGLVGDAAVWLYDTAAKPALDGIGTALSWLWDNVAQPALDGLKTGLGLVGDAATWLYDNAIKPAFDGIGSGIDAVWKNIVSPIFDAMRSGIGLVGDAFGAAGNAIKAVWNTVLDVLRPVAHAIGNALAAIPDKIGPFEVPGAKTAHDLGAKLQAFRAGGPVSGPGTGTSDS